MQDIYLSAKWTSANTTTLTATTRVVPPNSYIELLDVNEGVIWGCSMATTCSATDMHVLAPGDPSQTHTYIARIVSFGVSGDQYVVATSNPVSVTWHEPID